MISVWHCAIISSCSLIRTCLDSIILSKHIRYENEFIFFTFLEVPKPIGIYDIAYGILFKENKFSLVKAEITSPFYDSYHTTKVFEFDFYLSKI